MITLLYPKEDWTAAELSTKLQALASSRNISFYTTPKHGKRDEEHIARKLSQTDKAILLAHDVTSLDEDTEWELKELKKRSIPIYSVVPESMKPDLTHLGMFDHLYTYDEGDARGFNSQLMHLMKELEKESQDSPNGGELAAFLILLGLLLFLLWFLFAAEE